MTKGEDRLAQDRSLRGSARGLFDNRLAQVKADLAARGVGGRIKAKAKAETFKALDTGVDIASESKGIIAATVGALLIWAFRKPLIQAARELIAPSPVQDADDIVGAELDEETAA